MKFKKMVKFLHENQWIELENGGNKILFISYKSLCCVVDKEKEVITLGRDWGYSNTTLRHLYAFLDMFVYHEHRKTYIEKCIRDGKIGSYKLEYDAGMK